MNVLGDPPFQRKRLQHWEFAARSCGLQSWWTAPAAFQARKGQIEVRIEDCGRGDGMTRIVISVPGPPGFSDLKICRRAAANLSEGEIEIGDRSFDITVSVQGPMLLAFVLLDAEVRGLLVQVIEGCPMSVLHGELRAELFDYQVPSILRSLVELGRRFAEPLDAAERLAENAHLDPEAGVRLRNLRQLVREYPEDLKTLEALRISGSDPSPQVRFLAARELGAEGVAILLELEESEVEDDTWSAQTVSFLSRELTFDRARGVLVGALRKRRIGTARAFIQILGHFEDAAAVAMLAKVLAIETGELAEAAALALGATGNEAAEAPLIEALRRERTDVRMAAANALARVGSAAAVLPLKEAAGKGSLRHPELRRAARQAITEIQSRLQGAAPGQLSLAGDEAGRLSLAQAEAGQLALVTDTAGELSLSGAGDRPKPEPRQG